MQLATGVSHILVALADRDHHGYSIMQDARREPTGQSV
jgi:hypothetical protein